MRSTKHIMKLIRNLDLDIDTKINADEAILSELLEAQEKSKKRLSTADKSNIWRIIVGSRAGSLAAAFLIISSLVACIILSRKVADLENELEIVQRDFATAPADETAVINFYAREHQDIVARHASLEHKSGQPMQVTVGQDDILYYELLDSQAYNIHPGIIVRGPAFQQEISASDAPVISNGRTLSLTEAQASTDFDLVSPLWLNPGYTLDEIRRIEGRDAMHLLYTDGVNTLSLFEQPLEGQRWLSPKDFREYAVFRNKGRAGQTILTWKDAVCSYVLIGNNKLSQLIDMAQSISARRERKEQ